MTRFAFAARGLLRRFLVDPASAPAKRTGGASTRRDEKSPAQRTRSASASGFTLIEILVVMAILAFAAGIVWPRLVPSRPSLDEATGLLVRALRATREEALAEGIPRRLDLAGLAAALPPGFRLDGEGLPIVFLPNGAASGAVLRIEEQGQEAVGAQFVEIDWLTGRIGRRAP